MVSVANTNSSRTTKNVHQHSCHIQTLLFSIAHLLFDNFVSGCNPACFIEENKQKKEKQNQKKVNQN